MNPILDTIAGLFKPAVKLIDDLHLSGEEKLTANRAMFRLESDLTAKVLDYEIRLTEAKSSIIKAEASGQSWLQRMWRPITMLTFLGLVVCDSFGLLEFRLAEQAWTLLQIGLGGYVVGRSAEKIAPRIVEMMGKRNAA